MLEFLYVYCGMVAVAAIVLSVIGRRSFHSIEAEAARNSFAGLGETLRSLRLDRESKSSPCRGSQKSRSSVVPSRAHVTNPRPGMPQAVWPWPAP
ncbi:hypothetical protein [Palleronia abyssalis]|uniref:Uncharacterized protein n=1 Tax=Palleronia abyssalis TaxID=1501240 RepID=A0A2R8BZX7_9RHOB|nr:hypothetical protein [Palleronia abyssalis]SPJ25711.1 hypothetical protein PAA8504_03562 [Palleronia abyssalis]